MKAHLLASAVSIVTPPDAPTPAEKPGKPVPMIGTMQRHTTPEQRKAFAKMKRDMKRAARGIRYDQHLQERAAAAKP